MPKNKPTANTPIGITLSEFSDFYSARFARFIREYPKNSSVDPENYPPFATIEDWLQIWKIYCDSYALNKG